MKEVNEDLDLRLGSSSQMFVAKAVAALPEESVSMVWRSGLNEALRQQAGAAKKKRLFLGVFSPIAGLGLACALACAVMFRPTSQSPVSITGSTPAKTSMEASLVSLHQDDVRSFDVAGTGLNPNEAANYGSEKSTSSSADGADDDIEL